MISTVLSAVLSGIHAIPVEVQVHIAPGLPAFNIVGLPDSAVAESKERVRAAFKSIGLTIPAQRVTVNLAPAHVRKNGSGLDLPIAVALMDAAGYIERENARACLVVGELSLSGEVSTPPGIVSLAILASRMDRSLLTGPVGDVGAIVPVPLLCIESLQHMLDGRPLAQDNSQRTDEGTVSATPQECDFADVIDQDSAIRALTICAVGNHNLLMIGEPGTGKTMLARRLPAILPDLTPDQLLEVAQIQSVVDSEWKLCTNRPFRAPHHSASSVGMIGGGSPVRPGEVTLAHNGILFLDEIAEFKPATLQMLRQPLESGEVTIVRAMETVAMPARFQLIGTANPCPCGYYGSDKHVCQCSLQRIEQYRSRLGGPLIDRIDMTVVVPRPAPRDLIERKGRKTSQKLKSEVAEAIAFRASRQREAKLTQLLSEYLVYNRFTREAQNLLNIAAEAYKLSGRALHKTCRIARTIADIDCSDSVRDTHVAESMDYRSTWSSIRSNENVDRSSIHG